MAKRKRITNVERKHKEGRGLGKKEEHQSFLTTQDVPSKGRRHRVDGIKIKRQYNFMSDLEVYCFYIVELGEDVSDIWEQVEIPIEETLKIANDIGIKHPTDPRIKEVITMTTDLVVIEEKAGREHKIALSVKYEEDLNNERVIEKHEIERLYYKSIGAEYYVVTEKDIDMDIVRNIISIREYVDISDREGIIGLEESEVEDLRLEMIREGVGYRGKIAVFCTSFDNDKQLKSGTAICIFKHLLINQYLQIDLSRPFDVDKDTLVKAGRRIL